MRERFVRAMWAWCAAMQIAAGVHDGEFGPCLTGFIMFFLSEADHAKK